jgi:HK97 family phage major capsid protein
LDGTHDMSIVEAASTHDTLGEIAVADVVKLMAAVPTYAKTNAAFFCSPTALSLVFDSIKASAGGTDLNQLQNAVRPQFLGYPIFVSPLMPDDASANYNNAVMIAFGDMRAAALLGVRRDLRIMLSEHAFFANDQIGLRATMRHDFIAHSLGDSSSTKSPFCVLIGTT